MRIKTNLPFQTFNDGICSICALENVGEKGNLPVMKLRETAGRVPYERRRAGIQRIHAARQEQAEIEEVIRIPRAFPVSTQDICIIDGKEYGIHQVQIVPDVMPEASDLALKRLEAKISGKAAGKEAK